MDPALIREMQALSRLRAVDEAAARGDSAVQACYQGAVVFLTGGSGFLGKQLIEKLFRSCQIKHIYLLMRQKKGQSAQERLTKIFKDPMFNMLRNRKPGFEECVRAVQGDVTQLGLGISDEDRQILTNEVTVIFHVAATISFDEPLRVAVNTNVRGTMQALQLGKECKHLKSYVHVSTAYAHATVGRIGGCVKEDFYDSPANPNTIVALVEQLSEEKLNAIKHEFIKDWPNTYAFTKALAEEVVRTMSGDLPICIVRPAIVIGSHLEPSPGWVDISSVYGPSGILLGAGLGVMHTFMANSDSNIDLIPVDIVTNGTIAAGWDTAQRHAEGHRDVKIYTVTTTRNPIKWRRLVEIMYTEVVNYASPKAVWYNFAIHTKFTWLFLLLTWLMHYIPGYLADGILKLLGKKPKLYDDHCNSPWNWKFAEMDAAAFAKADSTNLPNVDTYMLMEFMKNSDKHNAAEIRGTKALSVIKLYRLAFKLSTLLSFYTCNEFHFEDDNLRDLYNSLSKTDKDLYNFDIEKMSWVEQLIHWSIGMRRFIVKDDLQGTKKAVAIQRVARVLNYFVFALYFYGIYCLFSFLILTAWGILGL